MQADGHKRKTAGTRWIQADTTGCCRKQLVSDGYSRIQLDTTKDKRMLLDTADTAGHRRTQLEAAGCKQEQLDTTGHGRIQLDSHNISAREKT